ncbi:MAG TPA: hypothetical protein VMK12_16875 [Anaeromyxobacteraceae bacterium]|nr:hypothetical protein [Anaeromyxobacteraceae bacterium]
MARVEATLRQGAEAHGFGTNLWTLPCVAHMIAKVAGSSIARGACGESSAA